MNVAIVIGVSEYADTINNLPGCKKDADIVNSILTKSNKYDEILFINEKISSAKIKERLTDFIAEHKSKKIEEIFFYYTGHGEFLNDEFYYLLSDFNETKRKQTSLQNEEIDNLIKTLKPDLVVKIIDACQSGKAYIKEANIEVKYFQKTQNNFNKCYFLNSSQKDQSSLQTDEISDFTLSFIKAIKEHNSGEIRYKDIIDFISDEFENNPSQTPFFVIQADYTEKFCVINEVIKEYLAKIDLNGLNTNTKKTESSSIIELIKKQALEYFTKEQALSLLSDLKIEVEKIKSSELFEQVFSLKILFLENYDSILEKNTIGKWLEENQHEYFAKSTYEKVRKDRFTSPFNHLKTSLILGSASDDDYELIRSGFDLEVEVPYKTIIFNLDSNFPNVDSYTCRIVYFLSKRNIRFFYFVTNFETKNWDERKLNRKIEWFSSEHPISNKSNIIDGIKKIYNALELKANKDLEEKFKKQEQIKE